MLNLTQLGSNLFLGSTYSTTVWVDDDGNTRVAIHTDKTRSYKSDWTPERIAQAIGDTKTVETRLQEQRKAGVADGNRQAVWAHNKLPWYKRVKKK